MLLVYIFTNRRTRMYVTGVHIYQ